MASGIHGHVLQITVVGCSKLKNTEWFSRQDPYVFLEYGGARFRTTTCTDGGKNPIFQEKFVYSLIEGLREINLQVWNSNTINHDAFIGAGKVLLQRVLSQGFDDSSWPIQSKSGRPAGEVRLIMFYENANKPLASSSASATPQVVICTAAPPPAPPVRHHSFPSPGYPPPPYQYPPPSPASFHYPPGYYSGMYPPPPY